MLLGQQLVDTAYVMQTRRGRDAALGMITKYLPFLDCVHCLLCLGITRHGDFCDDGVFNAGWYGVSVGL